MTVAVRCWKAPSARPGNLCQGLAVSAARWISRVPWLSLLSGWAAWDWVLATTLFLLLRRLLLCLSEVGKPSWVGIWFLGTDTFHGWRHYKSLKRDPALGRHSINTDNTSPSLLLTLSFLNNLFLFIYASPFSPLLSSLLLYKVFFFPNKKR